MRSCTAEDFPAIAGLLGQLWPTKKLDLAALNKVYQRALESEQQVYVCAADGKKIIGFGSLTLKNNLWQEGNLGHIDELAVDTAYRGNGIGTKLLEHLIEIARQKGCRRVELDSAFHRKQAHQFYEQNGFENRAFLFSKPL